MERPEGVVEQKSFADGSTEFVGFKSPEAEVMGGKRRKRVHTVNDATMLDADCVVASS